MYLILMLQYHIYIFKEFCHLKKKNLDYDST